MNRIIVAAAIVALAGLTAAFAFATGDHGAALAGGLEWGSIGH